MNEKSIADELITWQKQFGRHNLPWQVKNPYLRWISEIMLQQTQVSVVVDYFSRFTKRFPTLHSLCEASEDDVLKLWSGLGYYTRARNIWRCAQLLKEKYNETFPSTVEELVTLPGIGLSTAGAIASSAFDVPAPILDGNVKRVFSRLEAIDTPINKTNTEKTLWAIAHRLVPLKETAIYNQALMDIGAMVCTKKQPKCDHCPLAYTCRAHQIHREEDFPIRLRSKAKPSRQAVMTIFYSNNQIWFEKRQQKAVWQGLWSLPENLPLLNTPFSSLTHEFSHYKLIADVQLIDWTKKKENPSNKGRWIPLNDIPNEALPAPIKKMILANFRPHKA